MFKIVMPDSRIITPFNERARDLRIQNVPLWLHQRNVLARYTTREMELGPKEHLPNERVEMIVYRDNLFFDEGYVNAFIMAARKKPLSVVSPIDFPEYVSTERFDYPPAKGDCQYFEPDSVQARGNR